MTQNTELAQIARKRLVYQIPGMEAATVRRDVEYRRTDGRPLTFDLYRPPDARSGSRLPAVVLVSGYSDDGVEKKLGCKAKEMGASISKGQLLAASGLSAVCYETRDPATDAHALLQYVRQNEATLGVDANQMGLWAASGNVPMALSLLMQGSDQNLKCAALCYGFMLDCGPSTAVADASRTFGFVNPCAGKSVKDLRAETPLFVARAGRDEVVGLNDTIDLFAAEALECNLPLSLANHPAAPHAFDLMYDHNDSRESIRHLLTFLRFHLLME
jgi:hypothetical protein